LLYAKDRPLALALANAALDKGKEADFLPLPLAEKTLRLFQQDDPNAVARGQTGPINSIAVGRPKGQKKYLATASADNTVLLWPNLADLTRVPKVLRGHKSSVALVAFHDITSKVISCDRDNYVFRWDMKALANYQVGFEEDEEEMNLVMDAPIKASFEKLGPYPPIIALSTDARWLLTTDAGKPGSQPTLWNPAEGPKEPKGKLDGDSSQLQMAAFSANSKWLALSFGNADTWNIVVYKLATLQRESEYSIKDKSVRSVAVSNDGQYAVVGTQTDEGWLLSKAGLPPRQVLPGHLGAVTAVAFSPDQQWVVTGCADTLVRCWGLKNGVPVNEPLVFAGHASRITGIDFDIDDVHNWVFTCSQDGTARRWDLSQARPRLEPRQLVGHTDWISSIAASADGLWLATSDYHGKTMVWEIKEKEGLALKRAEFNVDKNGKFTTSPQDWAKQKILFPPRLVPVDAVGNRWLWDLSSDHAPTKIATDAVVDIKTHQMTGLHLLSMDTRWLVTGRFSENTLHLWDFKCPAAPKQVSQKSQEKARGPRIAFSSDSESLVAVWQDGLVNLWKLAGFQKTPIPFRLELTTTAVAVSSNQRWLVNSYEIPSKAANTKTTYMICRRDLAQKQTVPALQLVTGHAGPVVAMAVSNDGKYIVTGSTDKTIRLWTLAEDITPADLDANPSKYDPVVLTGHRDWITTVLISPNQKLLITASQDGDVRLWTLNLDDVLRMIRFRPFTDAEKKRYGVPLT
jgi:WD40 repeat protein